ncbi:Zinc finger protein KNUCKLES [Acorus calamus]|uniref:Zinc finger protein KNUCKLES n=1 Tax=Acorus calamus TaxID=4465 RepID=A0AAV9DPH3_ACOCL|nr:Zinc finger protein KNUCKLES [Acorus calamus]
MGPWGRVRSGGARARVCPRACACRRAQTGRAGVRVRVRRPAASTGRCLISRLLDTSPRHATSAPLLGMPPRGHAGTEATKTFTCLYCSLWFFTSQPFGDHQNAHKKERVAARRSFPSETSAMAATASPPFATASIIGSSRMLLPLYYVFPNSSATIRRC